MDIRPIMLLAFLALLPCVCAASPQITNPVYFINGSTALPTGVASYGLTNMLNDSGPYAIATNEVFGDARINSMYAYNASLTELNVSPYGVSLQLNAILNVTSEGHVYAYFVQDVADFNTSNMTYYMVDNVWNATTYNASLSNATIAGGGNTTGSFLGGGLNFSNVFGNMFNSTPSAEGFYGYATNSSSYAYPFEFEPVMRVTYNHGYPYLQFGYFENGSAIFYDNATFLIPNSNAYFQISAFNQTPDLPNGINSTLYYNTELVYGGEANGATINFDSMNSTLWIGYLKNGTIVPFPTAGTFGSNGAENATGISVNQGDGVAIVRTGSPNYNETILLSGVPSGLSVPPPPVQPTVPTTTIATATTTLLPSLPTLTVPTYYYVIFAVVILGIAYLYYRKRTMRPPRQVSK